MTTNSPRISLQTIRNLTRKDPRPRISMMTLGTVTSTMFIRMRRLGVMFLALLLMLTFGPYIYRKCVSAGSNLQQGRPFHVLSPGAMASFVTQGATDIHLLSYFVVEKDQAVKPSYALNLAFLSKAGTVYDERTVKLAVTADDNGQLLPDGGQLSQLRLVPINVPLGATILQVTSPDGRTLLYANQLVQNRGSQQAVIERSGRPVSWFRSDELEGIDLYSWITLPSLDKLPIIKLPLLTQVEEEAVDDAPLQHAELRVGPQRALVFNVRGPGKLTLSLESDGDAAGQFLLQHYGPRGAGEQELERGMVSLNLPRGPSSVILRPKNGVAATVHVETQKLHTLGRSDEHLEAAGRLGSGWQLAAEKPLRFGFTGSEGKLGPLRLTAHALDAKAPGTLTWRCLDAQDRELRSGEMALPEAWDPFTALMEKGVPTDFGAEGKIFVLPPPNTTAIELSAPRAVINVETLLEAQAQPDLLPPFDEPLGPTLRWHDVPVRTPRWLMLRPLVSQGERRELYAALLRVPRIEPIGPLPQGPWVPVVPIDAKKTTQILERTEHPSATQDIETLIPTGQETAILLPDQGKYARRVSVTCEVPGQLGGELMLSVDGRQVAKAPISMSSVRLQANAKSGVHRIRVDGISVGGGRCMVAARPALGALTVRRSVYQLPAQKGLTVLYRPSGKAPQRLHYAIYSASGTARDLPLAVTVDGGEPRRRVGSSATFTIANTTQRLHFAAGAFAFSGPEAGKALDAVAIAAVQLGDDLPRKSHRIKLRPLASGQYWARFWVEGRRGRPDTQTFIVTDATMQREVIE